MNLVIKLKTSFFRRNKINNIIYIFMLLAAVSYNVYSKLRLQYRNFCWYFFLNCQLLAVPLRALVHATTNHRRNVLNINLPSNLPFNKHLQFFVFLFKPEANLIFIFPSKKNPSFTIISYNFPSSHIKSYIIFISFENIQCSGIAKSK